MMRIWKADDGWRWLGGAWTTFLVSLRKMRSRWRRRRRRRRVYRGKGVGKNEEEGDEEG